MNDTSYHGWTKIEDPAKAMLTGDERRAERIAARKVQLFELYSDLAEEFGLSLDELYEAHREAAKGYNARIAFRNFLIRERSRISPDTSRSSFEDHRPSAEPTSPPAGP